MHNVLIFGAGQQDHDKHPRAALRHLETAGVTLNACKCEFSKDEVKFLGNIVNKEDIHVDPAVLMMELPHNIPEIRTFLQMANQVGKIAL